MNAQPGNTRPVLIMAGGTGGHIFPGLAVAEALSRRDVPVVWLGSQAGMENRLVPARGIVLEALAIGGLRGKGLLTKLLMPLRLAKAVWQALGVIGRHDPRAVLSFGGYAAGPGGLAAWLRRRPLLVHEQNRAPGLTNRVLAKLSRRVLCGFPDAFERGEWVGNPVRAEIAAVESPDDRMAERRGPLRLLVLGGSQGARALNQALPELVAALREQRIELQVRHQCGRDNVDQTLAAYMRRDLEVAPEPFIEDMVAAYAWADLVVCRAGALTLAEIAAVGLASILVPLPIAADDHQTRNAEFLVEHDVALLVAQGDGFVQRLGDAVAGLATDRPKLLSMARAARGMAKTDAADRVADAVLREAA
ncbi:MAG: undecaprenyldiphospho-muramoylpentapeptide beta-N-acetylglucosaminyltransferase [Lysobacteraceae bacterium]